LNEADVRADDNCALDTDNEGRYERSELTWSA